MKVKYFRYTITILFVLILLLLVGKSNSISTLLAQPQQFANELEKKVHEIENQLNGIRERLHQKIGPDERNELENRLIELVFEYNLQSGKLFDLTKPKPEENQPKARQEEWFDQKISSTENRIRFLEELPGIVNNPERRERLQGIKRGLIDEKARLENEMQQLKNEPERPDEKPDDGGTKESFWETFKHPAIIAAIISAIAVIVAAFLKRK